MNSDQLTAHKTGVGAVFALLSMLVHRMSSLLTDLPTVELVVQYLSGLSAIASVSWIVYQIYTGKKRT